MKKFLLAMLAICLVTVSKGQTSNAETDLKYYNLSFEVDPNVRALSAENRIHFEVKGGKENPVEFELSNKFDVVSIVSLSSGKKLKFVHKDNKIEIQPLKKWKASDSIAVVYKSNNDFKDTDGIQFTHVYDDGQTIPCVWTLSCPYAGGDWFVCKQDNTDKIDSVTISVTSPKQYRTASNGLLIGDKVDGQHRTMTWHHRHPIDYYLICMACSEFETYSDFVDLDDGSKVEILNMVFPFYLETAKKQSKLLIPVFQLYCQLFGNYPFADEKYGQVQFTWGGGMEHQTMTFVKNFNIDLTAHELSHQWFGDNITCNSWNEVWLNESFATYCEYLAAEKGLMGKSKDKWMVFTNHYATWQDDGKVYVDDAKDFSSIFNYATSYCKGALMLHQLRLEIGDEAFMRAMKQYATDPELQGKTAKGDDFIRHVNKESGQDMNWLFDQWLNHRGFPFITYGWEADGCSIKLKIHQRPSNGEDYVFRLKLPVVIKGPNGESQMIMVDYDSKDKTFEIKADFVPESVEVDPRCETISKCDNLNDGQN